MLCGAIDIGSNTTRLLVAEPQKGQLRKVMEQRAYTRIGKDASKNGKIAAAKNRDKVLKGIEDAAGVQVQVLDEDEEGRLAFLGATKSLGHPVEGTVAVVDVGGGSSEVIFGTLAEGVQEVQ